MLRLTADLVLINLSFAIGLILTLVRTLWDTHLYHDAIYYKHLVLSYLYYFGDNFLILSVLTGVVFYVTGFYNFGLAYHSKQKYILIIVNLLSVYGIFGAINRLLYYYVFNVMKVPGFSYAVALAAGTLMFIGSRMWSRSWANTQRSERKIYRKLDRKVKHVLVIGGGGYIGSALLPILLERGYKVKLLDLAIFGTDPIKKIINHPNLKFIRGDFRQVDIVVEAMIDVDAVVHLGGIVGDPACALDENLTIDINLVSTRMIVEAAKALGVQRFIFASTCSALNEGKRERIRAATPAA